jgi:ubiquinone/menaquinone biosynthesis C-methylase UbiE
LNKSERRNALIEILNSDPLTIEEAEQLSYYDLLAFLTTQIVGVGGRYATKRLGELCELNESKRVLVVGCGTGWGTCFLSQKFSCNAVGIDVSKIMVKRAKQWLSLEDLKNKVEFKFGDAYNLEFEDNSFDVVITEYVSQFFDAKVINELKRVIKPNGILGLNEVCTKNTVPLLIGKQIDRFEEIYKKLTNYPFKIRSSDQWKNLLEQSGFIDIQLEENDPSITLKEALKGLGGFRVILKIIGKMRKYIRGSEIIKEQIMAQKEAKKMMRDKKTRKYIGYALVTGRKK